MAFSNCNQYNTTVKEFDGKEEKEGVHTQQSNMKTATREKMMITSTNTMSRRMKKNEKAHTTIKGKDG